jgi:hypothetical protein
MDSVVALTCATLVILGTAVTFAILAEALAFVASPVVVSRGPHSTEDHTKT